MRIRTSISLLVAAAAWALASDAVAACSGANPNDWVPDDAALQQCINVGGTLVLDPGSPGYIVEFGLTFGTDGIHVTSSQAPSQTARIIAARNLNQYMLVTPNRRVLNFTIEYITLDGKVHDLAPDGTPWRVHRDECNADISATPGNVAVQGNNFTIRHTESLNAMCGSGMIAWGQNFNVHDNYLAYNGRDAGGGHPWADGLTVLLCAGGHIYNNTIVDNTDVGIALGGGNCFVEHNAIFNGGQYAFAGIHVGFFDVPGANGNHSGSLVQDNTIHGDAANRLGIGLMIGFDPWAAHIQLATAGEVAWNTIDGAAINLAVDGIDDGFVHDNGGFNPLPPGNAPGCPGVVRNYTAADFGAANIQGGWVFMTYDNFVCTF